MSMENELKRIADALECIAEKVCGAPTPKVEAPVVTVPLAETIVDAGKPVAKRKSTTAVPVAKKVVEPEAVLVGEVDFGGGSVAVDVPAVPVAMTPAELLKYANTTILGVKDTAKRTKIVQALKAMFLKDYGVASVTQIPVDKVAECYTKFETIMKKAV